MTIPAKTAKRRRKRGVILTKSGLERFQSAKSDAEYEDNRGNRYTLEALSEKTGISIDTLSKVFGREVRVDKQTLKCCFGAFSLELEAEDYYSPQSSPARTSPTRLGQARSAPPLADSPRLVAIPQSNSVPTSSVPTSCVPTSSVAATHTPAYNQSPEQATQGQKQALASPAAAQVALTPLPPGGKLALDSPLYIPRPRAEAESYQALDQPGVLVRIKGSRQTGKTSLMARIAQQARQRGFQPVYISFQLAEKSVLQDLDKLLQWFCASVGLGVGLPPELDTYWDSLFGSKMSCKLYFEQYLLSVTPRPVVLLLDDVVRLFHYPELADEFFGFLRTCYEEAKTSEIWQQLRVVIAQTSEVYIPLNINKSPFNVGIPITLLPFTPKDIQALAQAYGLPCDLAEATALGQLLGGQPYLTHLVMYHSWKGDLALHEAIAHRSDAPIFLPYLQQQQRRLQQNLALSETFKQLLNAPDTEPNSLSAMYQLQSLGLVTLSDQGPQVANDLLKHYFSHHLA